MFDSSICDSIVKLVKENGYKTAYDFGCGMGLYTLALRNAGVSADGFDGNPNTPLLTNGVCKVLDLSQPIALEKADVVLCLEVGEHIPKQYEDILFANIANNALFSVILSWAVPGQPGEGHINCRTNEYVSAKLREYGFLRDFAAENKLRNSVSNAYWFRNTLMVFIR